MKCNFTMLFGINSSITGSNIEILGGDVRQDDLFLRMVYTKLIRCFYYCRVSLGFKINKPTDV